MRKAIALYPYSSELLPVVKHFEELQNDYSIYKLFSPSGFGLSNQDAAYACNHPPVGISVVDNFYAEDPGWNTLILAHVNGKLMIDDIHLVDAATSSLYAGKSVVYYDNCQADVPNKIWELKESFSGKISIFTGDNDFFYTSWTGALNYTIDTPCVLIGGLVDEADVFEVLIALTTCFKKRGWKISTITTQPIGKCFGFYNLNYIFNQSELTEVELPQK